MLSPAEHIQGFNKHPKYNGKVNQIQICQTRRPLEERIGVKVFLLFAWQRESAQ